MLVPFNEMPDTARVWIYQAERTLSEDEVQFVEAITSEFLNGWKAHGMDLKASFQIQHQRFLILSVDEAFAQASGCSIDASVNLIKALESKMGLSFMNSSKVAFLIDDQVQLHPFTQLKQMVADQSIDQKTKIFDNTVKNVADFKSRWLTESGSTWVSRYF